MNFKETINDIKKILNMTSEEVEVKLGDIKLLDGTVINYDKLEVGGLVQMISADGSTSPVPAGSYDLEDGNTIEVDENGMITKIDVTVKAEEAPVEPVKQETEMNSELVDRISALEEAMKELININKNTSEKLESEIKKGEELSKKLDLATDAKPTKKIHDEAMDLDKMTPFQLHRYSKNK